MTPSVPFTPSREILEKYSDLLINYALGGGTGIRPGETVLVAVPECAKPFYVPLRDTVIRAGGHPIMQYLADDVELREMYNLMNEAQLSHFPSHYYRGLLRQVDHTLRIVAESDKHELEGVDPAKLMLRQKAMKPYRQWHQAKEAAGNLTWCVAMYGTPAMAADVGLSEQAYWNQIIKACFLDERDPIARWKEVSSQISVIKDGLNKLAIDRLHVEGEDADLWLTIGPNRRWLGGGGRNIPSFELFISPDWRGTEGWIRFNQPLYTLGSVIEDIRLTFANGRVIKADARKNEALLRELLSAENADKIGEFSLTDGRHSRITKVMGETLFDENMGGVEGNTHLAVGNAYLDSYPGDPAKVTQKQWKEWGYNQSVVHTDIVSTTRRRVTAYLAGGGTKVIYENGQFQI